MTFWEIVGVIVSAAGTIGALGYGLIERIEAKRERQKYLLILNDIHRLRAALFSFMESVSVIVEVSKMPIGSRSNVDYEVAYQHMQSNLLSLIDGLFESGHIVYLFPPKTIEFDLLNGVRLNISGSLANKIFLSESDLAIPQLQLIACAQCLEKVSQYDEAQLLASIKQNMRGYATKRERESIHYYKEILNIK